MVQTQTILVAESDDDIRLLLDMMLKARGYQVICAGSMREIQDCLRSYLDLISLVIINTFLVRDSGYQERRWYGGIETMEHFLLGKSIFLPTIYTSTYVSINKIDARLLQRMQRIHSAGKFTLLAQPFDLENFFAKVSDFVENIL